MQSYCVTQYQVTRRLRLKKKILSKFDAEFFARSEKKIFELLT